jgi:hypothetical protein
MPSSTGQSMIIDTSSQSLSQSNTEMSDLAKAIAEAITPDDMDTNDDEETKTNYVTKHK